ncbi:MAG TPA: sigma 54-interacting transcriptional regulator [Thiobacillus sp.]|nr:MAG: two-component system response regulator GlrR [Hydrogenophilales bacterium 28-61-11]OYZ56689.1 MAG: two-component system response regulator GlrR [Hydrogenophilales bacterium 16-61-112]OZA46298.1 MAG: two-component system response regulator GlrR [Hydrogenophilales bacterium 17-61-76]HQT31139.1 sigma 54-interacting transcriptional regulator [Thiobacillus sp.]HQT68804.1 sigma 54-interacting transcriptional regulator [Thiobacillus sp.]
MKKPAILVVDDDASLRELITLRLEANGFRVEAVGSGEAALAQLAVARPDAVLTDMQMAGIDGMALFRAIHARDPALPVIVLTAHGSIPDAVAATQQGLFGYLTKPYDAPTLVSLLKRATQLAGASSDSGDDSWRSEMLTASPAMETLLAEAQLAAQSEAALLIQGESGTGKELLARAIHRASPRRAKPFVAINCGAIPAELLESELFGHMKGAFTGAGRDHPGLFLSAQGGTVFLDEIGDMPAPLQVKLLRVLQEGEVRPVGATETRAVDVRILSATHRNLEEAIVSGEFREDLYYRLNVVNLLLPPLRERREDIPLLARHFLTELTDKYRRRIHGFSPEALEMLVAADWPGNIRQLRNVLEQCCALCTTSTIPASLVARALRDKPADIQPLAEARAAFERDYLITLLKLTRGQVSEVARLAGRNRTEVYRLLERHGLTPALFKERDDAG